MTTGYTRQHATTITPGHVIASADLNDELNQVQAALNATTGHNHDGTVGGGAPVVLANTAANSLKGNNTGSMANASDLTVAQVKALLAYQISDISGAGTTPTLFFSRNQIQSADLRDAAYTFVDKGTVSTGTVTFDHSAADVQRLQVGGALTIAFTAWPSAGHEAFLLIEAVNWGSAVVTTPTIQWVNADGSGDITTTIPYTFHSSATDFVVFWTRDGGTTIYGKVVR